MSDLEHAVAALERASIRHSLGVSAEMYSRTQNDNGSYNTRCLDCFITIAFSIESEEELKRLEGRHICPEKALAELLAQEKCQFVKPQVN